MMRLKAHRNKARDQEPSARGRNIIKRILLIVLACGIVLAGLALFNRKAIILHMAANASRLEVAPHQEIDWMSDPNLPSQSERPPNIIFILADDLGINDISTFGGGVAGGRVPTPNIDRLAAEGAIFQNAYAGTGTCAPSRAMLLTGRYPTRTGFEFTPTPPGMGRIVSMFSEEPLKKAGLPPINYNKQQAEHGAQYHDMGLPNEEFTIAEALKGVGYHTVHIGKWHLGRATPVSGRQSGI